MSTSNRSGNLGIKRCVSCGCRIASHRPHVILIQVPDGSERYKCTECDTREEWINFQENGVLTSKLVMEAEQARFYHEEAKEKSRWKEPILRPDQYKPVCAAYDRLRERMKSFERDRWFNGGLKVFVRAQTGHALVGDSDELDVRIMSMAGRCVITLEDKRTRQSITLVTDESAEPFSLREYGSDEMGPMGFQGFNCTVDVGVQLLDHAGKNWPANMKPGTVGYGGVRID